MSYSICYHAVSIGSSEHIVAATLALHRPGGHRDRVGRSQATEIAVQFASLIHRHQSCLSAVAETSHDGDLTEGARNSPNREEHGLTSQAKTLARSPPAKWFDVWTKRAFCNFLSKLRTHAPFFVVCVAGDSGQPGQHGGRSVFTGHIHSEVVSVLSQTPSRYGLQAAQSS